MLEIPWQKPEEIEKEKQQVQDHLIMKFFRNYIGPFLMKKPIKVFYTINSLHADMLDKRLFRE